MTFTIDPCTSSPEERLREYRRTGDRAIRNEVVETHRWLAIAVARDLQRGTEPLDDLIQVAMVALVKAADRFDPAFGVPYKSFAAVTARGELRRYYRDAGWAVRVPRRLQELRYEIRAATDVLRERLRRSPTTPEVADYLHVEVDEVLDAMCADDNFRSRSLEDRPDDGPSIADRHGAVDPRFDDCDALEAFHAIVTRFPPRMQRVLEMRYLEGRKQAEIAAEIGVSQVHVSRLLHQAHERIRASLGHNPVVATTSSPT